MVITLMFWAFKFWNLNNNMVVRLFLLIIQITVVKYIYIYLFLNHNNSFPIEKSLGGKKLLELIHPNLCLVGLQFMFMWVWVLLFW